MIHVAWSQGVLPEEEVPAMPREVKGQGASRGCRSLGPVGMRDGQREQRYRKLEGPTKARSQKALNVDQKDMTGTLATSRPDGTKSLEDLQMADRHLDATPGPHPHCPCRLSHRVCFCPHWTRT